MLSIAASERELDDASSTTQPLNNSTLFRMEIEKVNVFGVGISVLDQDRAREHYRGARSLRCSKSASLIK
jgi:hypothetical protein